MLCRRGEPCVRPLYVRPSLCSPILTFARRCCSRLKPGEHEVRPYDRAFQ